MFAVSVQNECCRGIVLLRSWRDVCEMEVGVVAWTSVTLLYGNDWGFLR